MGKRSLKIFGRNIIEYRSDANPPPGDLTQADLTQGFFGNVSKSGVNINETTAQGYAPFFACVRVISEALAAMPFKPYYTDGAVKKIAYNLPAYYLLNTRPNNLMGPFVFKDLLISTAITWGNAYAWKRTQGTKPVELEYIHPTRINVMLNKHTREIYYHLLDYNKTLPATEIIHLRGFGDDILGKSIVRVHMETLGLGVASTDLAADFYKNGGVIAGYLSSEGNLTKDTRTQNKASWQTAHAGADNRYNVAVLGGGMKYNRIGVPPEEGQFLESQKYSAQQTAAICKVPGFMIGAGENKFKDIGELNQWFYANTLMPWAIRMEEEFNYKIFTIAQQFSGKYYMKFNANALLRSNPAARAAYYKEMTAIGVFNINEIRKLEDLNPIADGNEHYIAANNMAPVGLQKEFMQAKIDALNAKPKTPKK